jgi:putative IMPACT (imprinted ancient) family translation regulator
LLSLLLLLSLRRKVRVWRCVLLFRFFHLGLLIASDQYTTIVSESRHSIVVKNSEFLGFAAPSPTLELALLWLEGIRGRYPEASHVCWAYKIGLQYRFSDDGEPSGTAGAPIFRVLELSGLDFLSVAVVRFYGGTNLGAGGLARAYGGVVAEMLRLAVKLEVLPRVAVRISVSFEFSSVLHRLLESFDLLERLDDFTESGLEVRFLGLESELLLLQDVLRDRTRGQGKLEYNNSR